MILFVYCCNVGCSKIHPFLLALCSIDVIQLAAKARAKKYSAQEINAQLVRNGEQQYGGVEHDDDRDDDDDAAERIDNEQGSVIASFRGSSARRSTIRATNRSTGGTISIPSTTQTQLTVVMDRNEERAVNAASQIVKESIQGKKKATKILELGPHLGRGNFTVSLLCICYIFYILLICYILLILLQRDCCSVQRCSQC